MENTNQTPSSPVSPTPPTGSTPSAAPASTPAPKKSKKVLWIILGVVALVAIVALAMAYQQGYLFKGQTIGGAAVGQGTAAQAYILNDYTKLTTAKAGYAWDGTTLTIDKSTIPDQKLEVTVAKPSTNIPHVYLVPKTDAAALTDALKYDESLNMFK